MERERERETGLASALISGNRRHHAQTSSHKYETTSWPQCLFVIIPYHVRGKSNINLSQSALLFPKPSVSQVVLTHSADPRPRP